MAIYDVRTRAFKTRIESSRRPMVPADDYGNVPPSLWGGSGSRPVMVNNKGEFKTRLLLETVHGTQSHYDLVVDGFRLITSWAEVGAMAIDELEVRRSSEYGDCTYFAEFIPSCGDFEYTTISNNDDVFEIHPRDFMAREFKILVPSKEIKQATDDDCTHVAYVKLDGATYSVVIHER